MGLMHIQVPGHGQVAVEVQRTAIFNDAQVMQVNPVLLTVTV